jgi:putative flippase GtrA
MRFWKRFLWFFLAGLIGFAVDSGVLYLIKGMLGLLIARVVSFACAVLATWLLNRCLTFRDRSARLGLFREFLGYLGLMLFGGTLNYAVYAWMVLYVRIAQDSPVLGVAAGSLSGMLLNFMTSRYFLYRHRGR